MTKVRPVIGIVAETLGPVPGQSEPAWIIEQRYVDVFPSLGAVPWIITHLTDDEEALKAIYFRLNGLFLCGGVDIDPSFYHEPRHPQCGRTDPPRDRVEFSLFRWASRDKMPILGICRGLQLINVALGGTLHQDIPSEVPGAIQHDFASHAGDTKRERAMHAVQIEPGSQLAAILGNCKTEVNSIHHQAIKRLAPGLVATARAPDGLIEGVESVDNRDQFLLAVQWHPEELTRTAQGMQQLFQTFLAAAEGYQPKR
jgi:putative glutamine amidotransferase